MTGGRVVRALGILAALLVAVGAVLWLLPPSGEPADGASLAPAGAVTAERGAEVSAVPDSLLGIIVEGNVFSPERQPPATAFRLEEEADESAPEPDRPRRPALRLYGVVADPSDPWALIEADPSVAGAEVYRVGDRVNQYRLVTIEPDSVVLEGSSGRRVLRLPDQ